MSTKKIPEFRLDSFNLIAFILKYWKLFILIGILSFVISVLVSLTIKPHFRSGVTLYPSSGINEPASEIFNSGSNVITFGDEEATEKILQML